MIKILQGGCDAREPSFKRFSVLVTHGFLYEKIFTGLIKLSQAFFFKKKKEEERNNPFCAALRDPAAT